MKLIEDGKYELRGPNEDSMCLPVSPKNLPATTEIEGYTLTRRTTFHATLVAIGKIVEKHNVSIPDFLQKVIADFSEFTRSNEISLIRYRDEFRLASQNERRSVVAMCDILNLDKFFNQINEKYGLHVEYPPTHVTLYTLQPDAGIFLTDARDIELLTKPVKIPALRLG